MPDERYYDLPDRRSMRLQSYDYRQPGYYYITICVAGRRCLLSNIVDAQVQLSPCGFIVEDECKKLSTRFQHVHLDRYVIMPNHVHAIIIFEGPSILLKNTDNSRIPNRFRDQMDVSSHQTQPAEAQRTLHNAANNGQLPILGEVVRILKAACTYRVRKTGVVDFAWEGRLYEHVIRNNPDLTRIRTYINNNPASWHEDILRS